MIWFILQTIEGLKTVIMMSQTTVSREVDSRLRVDDSDHGLTAPCELYVYHCV